VLSLLGHHVEESGFLEDPPIPGVFSAGDLKPIDPGALFAGGRFRLIRVLGTGGMGVVYEAEQDSPRRRVALKVVRAGVLSPGMLRRFRQEAEALARLAHPGIAQVYEAGVDAEGVAGGVPFITMELVAGRPLNAYIAGERLSVRDRLELFTLVCDAVTHAHERGVIHRDLKPANILVAEGGHAKVLDFGIARFIDRGGGTASAATASGQVLGTLSYMSPEQARGETDAVDLRADVYSLGVILYELLAGRLPMDLSQCSVYEGVRRIVDDEPSHLGTIDKSLRGDLETIAAKAIEKDRDRRYPSAAALADDVRRYLRDEPIGARPATTWYQATKFARRNKGLVGGIAAVIAALSVGLTGTAWQARAAGVARDKALTEAESTRQALEFLGTMLASVTPENARGKQPTMREALDIAAARLDRGEVKSDSVRAFIHADLGRAFAALGEYGRAMEHMQAAQTLERRVYGPESANALSRVASIARCMELQGQEAESVGMLRDALDAARRVHGPDSRTAIYLSMQLANATHPAPESHGLYRDAYESSVRSLPPDDDDALMAMANYGFSLETSGDLDGAERITRECLDRRTRVYGPDHPNTLDTQTNVAVLLARRGKLDEACDLMERMVETQERVLTWNHPEQIKDRLNAAMLLFEAGRYARCADLMERNIAAAVDRYAGPCSQSLRSRGVRVSALVKLSRFAEAQDEADLQLRETLATCGPNEPNGDPPGEVFQAWSLYYDLYQAWKQSDPSKGALQEQWKQRIASTVAGKAALDEEASRGEDR
jgi:tetratricopeptide (TPR) repeat protein